MSATKLTSKAIATTVAEDDLAMVVDVSDTTGSAQGTSKQITVANLLKVNNLSDVNAPSPSSNDVLKWSGSPTNKWQPVDWLAVLYAEFKQGADTTITNGAGTASELELTATTAKLKTGISEILITETSPGDIDFIVATDATGSTAYTALNIDGSTTANEADINVHGKFYIHDVGNTTKAYIRLNSASNVNLSLPTSSGTLALTSDVPSVPVDSVNGQTGVVVLDTDDIAEGTNKYNVQSDWNASSGLAVILNKPTLTSGTVTSVAMTVPSAFSISGSPITTSGTLALSVGGTAAQYIDGTGALQTLPQGVTSVSGTAPIVVTGTNTPTVSITAATTSAAGSMSSADKTKLDNATASYEEDELKTGMNATMNTSVSVASNTIVDIMGDALADTSNANSKKFLGFHTGSSVCVLQGMVDAGASISGATGGSPLWIGASGAFSATAPTTTNYYSRVVGHYIGTGQGGEELVYFNPSQDWVQIS